MKILLIEDDIQISELVKMILQSAGYEVKCVYTGEESIEIFHEYDIILLNLILPGIQGNEILKMIAEKKPNLPVIIASGYLQQLKVDEKTVKSIKGKIEKPFIKAKLLKVIKEAEQYVR